MSGKVPFAEEILEGNRRALARAVTLVESGRAEHQIAASRLLTELSRSGRQALRVGLSGAPGAGKSTFIEAFGLGLVERGLKVAVLAVDPSSTRSGGSILGDKTRMERLARSRAAFIRPSPSQSQLGGVARRSREVVVLCEAAGFDVVLIETVGVGQSEIAVAGMCDLFLLLLAPAAGDELQGVKRGIMELADLVLVNKADGDLKAAAVRTCSDYAGALRLLRKRPRDPDGIPKALTVSALEKTGLDDIWNEMQALAAWRRNQGHWQDLRAEQARHWFESELRDALLARLNSPKARHAVSRLGDRVAKGKLTPEAAVKAVLETI